MKIFVWSLILTFNLTAVQAIPTDPDNCAGCDKALSGQPTTDELKDIEKITKHDNSKAIRALSASICAIYSLSGVNIAKDTKKAIKKHMKQHENNSNPTGAQMLQFLNRNRHKMTCRDRNGVYKNYMKFAFDRSAHGSLFEALFMDELIPDDLTTLINVNAVSNTGPDGSPETVLDYMDKIIAGNGRSDGFIDEVKALREIFIDDLGAKKYTQLSSLEKKQAKEQLNELRRALATSENK